MGATHTFHQHDGGFVPWNLWAILNAPFGSNWNPSSHFYQFIIFLINPITTKLRLIFIFWFLWRNIWGSVVYFWWCKIIFLKTPIWLPLIKSMMKVIQIIFQYLLKTDFVFEDLHRIIFWRPCTKTTMILSGFHIFSQLSSLCFGSIKIW